jgi:hypothetical protein
LPGTKLEQAQRRAARAIYGLPPAHTTVHTVLESGQAAITENVDWSEAPQWRRDKALLEAMAALDAANFSL